MWQEEVNRLENTDRPWQAIIFVERRMAAYALWQLLSTCPILDFLSCQVLMGQGGVLQSATHTFKVSTSKHGTHQHPVCPGTRSWQQSAIHCRTFAFRPEWSGLHWCMPATACLHDSWLVIAFDHPSAAQ